MALLWRYVIEIEHVIAIVGRLFERVHVIGSL